MIWLNLTFVFFQGRSRQYLAKDRISSTFCVFIVSFVGYMAFGSGAVGAGSNRECKAQGKYSLAIDLVVILEY